MFSFLFFGVCVIWRRSTSERLLGINSRITHIILTAAKCDAVGGLCQSGDTHTHTHTQRERERERERGAFIHQLWNCPPSLLRHPTGHLRNRTKDTLCLPKRGVSVTSYLVIMRRVNVTTTTTTKRSAYYISSDQYSYRVTARTITLRYKKYVVCNVYLPAQCCCIQYIVMEIFDCNCNDLELERFKVIQGQRAWSQSKAHWRFPIWPPLSPTSYLSPFSRYLTLKIFFHRSNGED